MLRLAILINRKFDGVVGNVTSVILSIHLFEVNAIRLECPGLINMHDKKLL